MDFLNSKKQQTCYLGGIGSGKSFSGACHVVNMVALYPKVPGLILANSYQQLQSATLQTLEEVCTLINAPYSTNMNKKCIYLNETEILVRSADTADNCRGFQVGWIYSDESAYMTEEQYNIFMGRLRDKRGPLTARFTTTPNSFNWLYHLFSEKGDKHDPSRFELIKTKTSDNYHLSKDYIAMLKASYSQKFIEQEVMGEFVSLSGQNCYEFERKRHVKECHSLFQNKLHQQLFIAADWNLSPMTASVGFIENEIIYIIDEIYLTNGDVRMLASAIKSRYGDFKPIVIGDGTSNNTRSIHNLKVTNYSILKEEGITTNEFHNPHVYKRLANVNGHLYHNRLFVDPRCRNIIKDLELVQYKKGTNEIDKTTDKDLTHCSDNLGYLCWKLKPLEGTSRPSRVINF